jgi:hypothetical protein
LQSHVFHFVLAICLVGGTWYVSRPVLHPSGAAADQEAARVVLAAEDDVMDLRTGDVFWGIHLDGVVPCSNLLVKGGGHLVTLSVPPDRDGHCIYHVAREKPITLHGRTFRLRVVAADQIHVERKPASTTVVTNS